MSILPYLWVLKVMTFSSGQRMGHCFFPVNILLPRWGHAGLLFQLSVAHWYCDSCCGGVVLLPRFSPPVLVGSHSPLDVDVPLESILPCATAVGNGDGILLAPCAYCTESLSGYSSVIAPVILKRSRTLHPRGNPCYINCNDRSGGEI